MAIRFAKPLTPGPRACGDIAAVTAFLLTVVASLIPLGLTPEADRKSVMVGGPAIFVAAFAVNSAVRSGLILDDSMSGYSSGDTNMFAESERGFCS